MTNGLRASGWIRIGAALLIAGWLVLGASGACSPLGLPCLAESALTRTEPSPTATPSARGAGAAAQPAAVTLNAAGVVLPRPDKVTPALAEDTATPGVGTLSVATVTPSKATELPAQSFEQQLAAVFKRYQTLGATVCVFENAKITHTYCYGDIDRDQNPIMENTLFRVGSISKMVSTMGVMRLVEEGKAELDGDISAYLGLTVRNPQYPDTPITLRQLLSHTAGFRDSAYYTLALKGEGKPLDKLFSTQAKRFLFQQNLEPGTRVHYSNFGGGLLGSIVEHLTGETVDTWMNREVFAPLVITAAYQSALLPEDVPVSDMYAMPSRALAKVVRDGVAATFAPEPLLDYTLTAGKLTLSAPDLAKLLMVLCDGGALGTTRVLTEGSVAQMLTPQNNIGSVACESGRGLCVNILKEIILPGRTVYGHGGKANGMLCAAYFDPTDRTGVVMLTNGCNNRPMEQDVGKLSIEVIRLCYATWIDASHNTENPWLVEE